MRHFHTENDVSTPYEFLDVISEKDRVPYFSSDADIHSLPSWVDDNTLPSDYDSVYSSWAATSNSVEDKYAVSIYNCTPFYDEMGTISFSLENIVEIICDFRKFYHTLFLHLVTISCYIAEINNF